MSLEESLDRNTAALEANTKAILGGGGAATTAAPAGRPRGRPPGNKGPTLAEVKAIGERVRDEKSRAEVVTLLSKYGAAKVAELDEKHYAAFVAAAEVLLSDGDGDGDGDEI